MFRRVVCRNIINLLTSQNTKASGHCSFQRKLAVSKVLFGKPDDSKDLILAKNFESVEKKNKNTYLEMVKIFEQRGAHRRGHVEFIYSALKNMKSFGVDKDLEVYKALVDVLPKGRFIPTNMFQAEFMHYPKQQQCIIDLLEQMEDNGVIPDYEMEDMLINIFGKRGHPLRKFWRMMYWMPKFKNLSPWPLPDQLPDDILELAKIAINRISAVDYQSKITVFQTADIADSVEDTWIVSAQSPTQQKLLSRHDPLKPVYVEGAFKVWIKSQCVNYFILRADPKEPNKFKHTDPDNLQDIDIPLFNITAPREHELAVVPTVHEQEDGTIFAICATGTSGRDSLLSWIRHLEKNGNECLASIPTVFTLKAPEKELAVKENKPKQQDGKDTK